MKTQNPLIGRSRKSYGDATFYTLNGENIVRTKPMVVSNPNTPAQEAQRIRFAAFTAAANSLSGADLNLLFATKTTGRNRRSMLQAQLAPAYGVQASSDPTAAERYVPTFDISKVGNIGSGSVGYIGDFVEIEAISTGVTLTTANQTSLSNNIVGANDTDTVIVVMISEDGCIMMSYDSGSMVSDFKNPVGSISLESAKLAEFKEHGDKVFCYAIAAETQTLAGGSFIIIKRPQKTGRNQKHNVPVQ